MATYREKPVIVEAWQWKGKSLGDAMEFCQQNGLREWCIGSREGISGLIVPTLVGSCVCQTGDWIIKDSEGEFSLCKPDSFEKTYELVEE